MARDGFMRDQWPDLWPLLERSDLVTHGVRDLQVAGSSRRPGSHEGLRSGIWLPQLASKDLPGGRLRQLGDDLNNPGVLVGR